MDKSSWRAKWTAFRQWFAGRERWQRILMIVAVGYLLFIGVQFVAVGIGNLIGGGTASTATATTSPPGTTAATSQPGTTAASSANTIEFKMAVIDGHSAPSASVVGRYEAALRAAATNCPQNTKQQLADMSVRSTQLLADRGVRATTLEVVTALNDSVSGLEAGDCTEVFAALITLMTNG